MPSAIPHIDLWPANRLLEKEFFTELKTLYRKAAFSGGEYVERFERDFSSALGAKNCVGLNSGTSAIHLALLALGIGPGDEVIVPAYTFAGTAWGVLYCGATPVFCDVELETGNLSTASVEKALTTKTRAIIVVHLFGQAAKLDALMAIAKKRKIPLIEDAAQTHGGAFSGRALGTLGEIGCFSFYPTKNLGACGEGGAIVTDNAGLAERIRLLRNHNAINRYEHIGLGFNYRMEGIQGLFLSLKLKRLEAMNQERRRIAKAYLAAISDSELMPLGKDVHASAWHAFVIRVKDRAGLIRHLDGFKIGHAIYYPKILPELPPFRKPSLGRRAFPNASELSRTSISLPLYPGLSKSSVSRVVQALKEWR
jgi:dTDP-4-amino-4,6-dideoxygalactose transaminase